MKKTVILLLVITLSSCSTIRLLSKLNKAQKMYLNNVDYVENIIKGKEKPTFENVKELSGFFMELTNIKLNVLDLLNSTQNDNSVIKSLENWYTENGKNLKWDEANQQVYLDTD
ncbi:MAG TPA: hypothetical protein EYG92_05295 [Lutibacter sp.]|nr:hypothetical protein [Lutibacter sp.]